MEPVLLPLLMLSISDYLDTTYIIVKLMPIPLFLELSESTILNPPLEVPLTVSPFKTMKMITGLFVPLMEPPLPIGSALSLKLLDYLAPKKEKLKPPLKLFKLLNLYWSFLYLPPIVLEIGIITSTELTGSVNVMKEENNLLLIYLPLLVYLPSKSILTSIIDLLKKVMFLLSIT